MKITKYGHCCLLIEEGNLRILTDPGNFSEGFTALKNIDVILITHEHQDHFHIPAIDEIIRNNPKVRIITNKSVATIIDQQEIKVDYDIISDSERIEINEVLIQGYGSVHQEIYNEVVKPVENTGYFIANRLFYPGDSLYNPGREVEILALPTAGPWLNIKQSIDYAFELNPSVCFPVHDGVTKIPMVANTIIPKALEPKGIKYVVIENGKSHEF
jgi:L-ascorbate metabolism protein UlaG (beta-lactamase superfamily)